MQKFCSAILVYFFMLGFASAQELPKYLTAEEKPLMQGYLESLDQPNIERNNFSVLPPSFPVRNMAEWEEAEYLVISRYNVYQAISRQIVQHGRTAAKVLILCPTATDSINVRNNLINNNISLENVFLRIVPSNSVWIRDYFGNSVYKNDVDSLIMVDWVYNRPRPADNNLPVAVAEMFDIPLYRTSVQPFRLLHTGGNYMSNGKGQAFSSELVLDENPTLTETQVDGIMESFMGIHEYIKMVNLPYDVIHHIDMHMKILDEETLIVGEYPQGISDGPQIEANLQYVIDNYETLFNTNFKVIRIPMPPPPPLSGWPNQNGPYRTYANMKIINDLILVPIYNIPMDEVALNIIRNAKPGYRVKGINVNGMINAGGAIHCITHSIGVKKPLLIVHKPLRDTIFEENGYQVEATIKHIDGIANAKLFWTSDTTVSYQEVTMILQGEHVYTANIEAAESDTEIFYYIEAESNSGKIMKRPFTAPQGYWHFTINSPVSVAELEDFAAFKPLFPNPAKAITCIPFNFQESGNVSLVVYDAKGREVETLFKGSVIRGEKNFFLDAAKYEEGFYQVTLYTQYGVITQKLVVQR